MSPRPVDAHNDHDRRTRRAAPLRLVGLTLSYGFRLMGVLSLVLCEAGAPALKAQCGANPIVCENLQAGAPASEWDVAGAGDTTLQGFATAISVNRGATVGFKVDTSAQMFSIDVYRLGHYGGAGARKVA